MRRWTFPSAGGRLRAWDSPNMGRSISSSSPGRRRSMADFPRPALPDGGTGWSGPTGTNSMTPCPASRRGCGSSASNSVRLSMDEQPLTPNPSVPPGRDRGAEDNTDTPSGNVSENELLTACFEQQAKLHASRTALGGGAWQPTYAELARPANGLAHRLLDHGGEQADRIAVLMRHDTPLVAAVLAVLKAGRVVVVLNPTDPPARLAQVLEDAQPRLILTDPAHRERAGQLVG